MFEILSIRHCQSVLGVEMHLRLFLKTLNILEPFDLVVLALLLDSIEICLSAEA